MKLIWGTLALLATAGAQTPPIVETGTLPRSWVTGGPNCLEVADWQVHAYNSSFFILRESGCTNYEKPFLYLIFGKDRALLVDTGAGPVDTAAPKSRSQSGARRISGRRLCPSGKAV